MRVPRPGTRAQAFTAELTAAGLRWDAGPLVRRVVRWVAALEKGQPDREQSSFPSEFVDGGSIGPAGKE